MSTAISAPNPDSPDAEEISREKVEQLIEEFESESATRKLSGPWAWIAGIIAASLSIYALYWTQAIITTQVYRATFLMLVLVLTFLYFPFRAKSRANVAWYDIVLAALSVASMVYLSLHFREALQRVTQPTPIELAMGAIMLVLVIEATRRTTGLALTLVAIGAILYALFGYLVPEPFDHRGISLQRLIGTNYLTLQGVFGVPLDVAATFIVLFTIYGAVLEYSGAGKFFIDWSFAALGKSKSSAGPGRTVAAAGFLLGTVSGSGVATTVTLSSLSWPMLRKAGYDRTVAAGMLSASGIGATLSPPTLGAAAFLIAEYLDISYLDVLIMAMVPTVLYYLSIFLMIEADSRLLHTRPVDIKTEPLWDLTKKFGYHFSSLFAVAVLMAIGLTPFMAVYWSIVIAFLLSFLRPETRLTSLKALAAGAALAAILMLLEVTGVLPRMRPSVAIFWGMMLTIGIAAAIALYRRVRNLPGEDENMRILRALEYGGRSVISIAATTACAGIIVSVVTLTGLGLKISGMIVNLGGGNIFFTIFFAALAVWVLGLAVPVTASYILAAVMIVPALRQVGVPEPAAHMFIFYYAVLADVSPPTALAPMAAAAITGGKPWPTMFMAWKYCMPAFLVPFMFTLTIDGASLLLLLPKVGQAASEVALAFQPAWYEALAAGGWITIAITFLTSCVAVGALAVAFGGWLFQQANLIERVIMAIAGLAMLYADLGSDTIGFGLFVAGLIIHVVRVRYLRKAQSVVVSESETMPQIGDTRQ
ncbi:TRAP transporter fused permease subunit [Chloroflexus sp.]|uniref:TRAP transporter permease n=1 Tax=Chloroflexus sp. TaxID=1904827 RepID=UPI00298F06C1|nr:TRAP transporter fused permease subunit [Chloroflexus sp.]MCS6888006.1 TRAP transporter fused permease subunit [Chloroflexus sp.]MDW8403408.1 TRAP transporter fused permease subunit [Chloroflexus sp.]